MDLADLRLLETVAELGSFTAAAGALRLSQPSVSARVAAIERTLGAQLFTRDTRGARLTPGGARYLGYVRRSLRLLDEAARAVVADELPPTLHVGIPPSYAPTLAPLICAAAHRAARPVQLHTGHSSQLRADVLDRRLSLALVTRGPVPVGLQTTQHTTTKLTALKAPGNQKAPARYALHDWDQAADMALSELLGRGVPRDLITVVSPASAAIALALRHDYVAVVPDLAATEDVRGGSLVPAKMELPQLTTHLDWLYRPDTEKDAIDTIVNHPRPDDPSLP